MTPVRAPRVSIALPVYNGERFLGASLESLLTQDFEDFELIITDNGSTDATPDICAEAARGDSRVSYHRSPVNRGLAWNWNRAVPLATGTYFKWAASDDLHLPGYLSATVDLLDHDPGAVLAHTRSADIDADGRRLGDIPVPVRMDAPTARERFRELTRTGWPCVQVFGLTRLAALRRTGLHGAYPRSDRALLAELGLAGRLEHVDDLLFLRRDFQGRATRAASGLRERYPVFTGRPVRGPVFPTWRLFGGFGSALRRADLAPPERLASARALLASAVSARGGLKREVLQLRARPHQAA